MYVDETQKGMAFCDYKNLLLVGGGDHRNGKTGGNWEGLRNFVQQYYPSSIASTATGTIISIATIFDIAFNLLFGKIIDQMGYHLGFMILPVSMIIFYMIVNFLIKKYKPLRNLGEA